MMRDHDEASAPELDTGLQGEGGACHRPGSASSGSAVHPNQTASWKVQLEGGAADVLGPGDGAAQPAVNMKSLHAKLGELTLENDFLEGALTKRGLPSAKRSRASGDWLCHSKLSASVYQLLAALIRSATISAIKMVVGLVATDGTSGIIEASPA
jgi:hypothetical protein